MPVTYEVQGTVLRFDMEGEYEPEDVIRVFLEAIADPKTPKRVALLADVSRSEAMARRSPEEIRMVAEFVGPYAERIGRRCAIVADSTLLYGLSRMGSAYTSAVGIEARVFRDVESALAWLEVATKV